MFNGYLLSFPQITGARVTTRTLIRCPQHPNRIALHLHMTLTLTPPRWVSSFFLLFVWVPVFTLCEFLLTCNCIKCYSCKITDPKFLNSSAFYINKTKAEGNKWGETMQKDKRRTEREGEQDEEWGVKGWREWRHINHPGDDCGCCKFIVKRHFF